MSDPIEDYIRANREQYPRGAVNDQLLAAGHDRAAIKAAWGRLDQPGPDWNAAATTTKWTARRWALVSWTVAVWVVGILWGMSAGASNCAGVLDAAAREVCASTDGQTVTGMFLAYAVFPVWLIGFGVLALLFRSPKGPREPKAPTDPDAAHP